LFASIGIETRSSSSGDSAGRLPLYAFVMVLSYSRKEVVVWSERMDRLAWHHAHNEAFRRLGGGAD
jgi:hypothetical protein